MPVRKLSVALDIAVADAASRAARREGISLSGWLNHAAENQLAIETGLDSVREWELEHGDLTDAELAAADAILDSVTELARQAG